MKYPNHITLVITEETDLINQKYYMVIFFMPITLLYTKAQLSLSLLFFPYKLQFIRHTLH